MSQCPSTKQTDCDNDSIAFEVTGEFRGHSNAISCIGISKNNQNTIITSSTDGTCAIYDLSQKQTISKSTPHISHTLIAGKLIKKLHCHKAAITSIDIDNDGQYLLTASNDTSIKVWNLNTFSLQRLFNAHKHEIVSVSVSNNTQISYSCSNQTVFIWNTMAQIIHTIHHKNVITSLMLSPNNKYLIIAHIGVIKIYFVNHFKSKSNQKLRSIFKIFGHKSAKYKLAISPDSTCMACADQNGMIKLYQMSDALLICTFKTKMTDITDICFAKGKYWLLCAYKHYIFIWDLMNKSLICELDILKCTNTTQNGMSEGMKCENLCINCMLFPYGNTIFIGCNDGRLRCLSVIIKNESKESESKKNAKHLNVTLQFELKMERIKNEKLVKEMREMKMKIKGFETNENDLKSEKLNGFEELQSECHKLRNDLSVRKKEYRNLKTDFLELAASHKNMINVVHYKLWKFDNIIDWICSLDNGKYGMYCQVLHTRMKRENVRGIELRNLEKSDLERFGITDCEHKNAIWKYIKALTKKKKTKGK